MTYQLKWRLLFISRRRVYDSGPSLRLADRVRSEVTLGVRPGVNGDDRAGDKARSGLARKATAAATSSGSPYRPRATIPRMTSAIGLLAGFISVSMGPGRTRFAVMFRGPNSRERPRVNARSADFDIAYLMDSAAALTGSLADVPWGCTSTLPASLPPPTSHLPMPRRQFFAGPPGRRRFRRPASLLLPRLSSPTNSCPRVRSVPGAGRRRSRWAAIS